MLPMELRKKVIAEYKDGMPVSLISQVMRISQSAICRLLAKKRETGSIEASYRGRKSEADAAKLAQMETLVTEKPDITLAEIKEAELIHTEIRDQQYSSTKAWISVKKKMVHASERDRADVVEKRAAFRVLQANMDRYALVFLDESGVNIAMARRYGRAKNKQRVLDSAPLNTPVSDSPVS